ncbi:T9SS type A sorting domain-containing protein [Dyadobacter frigoris]|uniref:T9SS type A sorting domain-containing protein n=1 Tax=Dyadobacter frigoris TaxID=2576211 RepID=A0A4U6D0G0_9BACT|nr:T9SS type A sorting domain-containing protein [Dyadobacter frigoris]TKT90649.1 T9SS type A sorting domain-containing protein [Dyadobacter frigoris]GLU51198.1 hypothetical protein Dfri01_06590 [Dyadobacter frigoris]
MRLHLLIFFALFNTPLIAQTIVYQYDNAGNRILRKQNAPLPVTLISFVAIKTTSSSEEVSGVLSWQTSTEINSDYFKIERSQDGKKWLNIGDVKANGDKSSSSYYSFIDKSPADGENLYRLKMIDKDGSSAYSRIQSLNFDPQISFYPNPVKDLLKIKGAIAGVIQLFNVSGKSVLSLGNIPANGVDVSDLPSGVYLVRITLTNGLLTIKKIVKQ